MEIKEIKTTDGHDLLKARYYFLENGDKCYLNEAVLNGEGETMFLVTPCYEVEVLEGYADSAGNHREMNGYYLHDGCQKIVKHLFKTAPKAKIEAEYAEKLKEIECLALTIGDMKQLRAVAHDNWQSKVVKARELKDGHEEAVNALAEVEESVSKLNDKLIEKTNRLTSLEALIGKTESEGDTTLISKKELAELQREACMLRALQAGGVDNWEWYSETLQERGYFAKYPSDDEDLDLGDRDE